MTVAWHLVLAAHRLAIGGQPLATGTVLPANGYLLKGNPP